jgi:hypothetical protein
VTKIHATLHDAGTILRKQRYHPGADTAWWTDNRLFEDRIFDLGEKIPQQNAAMRDLAGMDINPWPETFPAHVWVDWTNRYEWRGGDGGDGLGLDLYQLDQIADKYPPLPGGTVRLDLDGSHITDPVHGRLVPSLTWREVRDRAPDPTEWYRLDTLNETGGAGLQAPLGLVVDGARNPVVLAMPDQSLFTPFDLRDGSSRYRLVDQDGQQLPDAQLDAGALALNPRGHYRLWFRPRRWRYFAVVYAVYLYISFFEMFYVSTAVSYAWYDRPPTYPVRHNVLANPSGGDGGINWQFEHSLAAAQIRRELFDNQWWTFSEAFVFHHIDHTELWAYRYWPLAGEYVVGIERVDDSTGRGTAVWAMTKANEQSRYPQELIYYDPEVPFYVTGPGGVF